jgi:hypothetical protein
MKKLNKCNFSSFHEKYDMTPYSLSELITQLIIMQVNNNKTTPKISIMPAMSTCIFYFVYTLFDGSCIFV